MLSNDIGNDDAGSDMGKMYKLLQVGTFFSLLACPLQLALKFYLNKNYSRFRFIGPPVNRVSRLIGPNC